MLPAFRFTSTLSVSAMRMSPVSGLKKMLPKLMSR